MAKTPKRRSSSSRVGKVSAHFLLVALVGALAVSAAAARPAEVIVLPGATSAEGIAAGEGRPSTPATCSPATSSAATCSTARPSCSSTPPTAAWPPAWSPTTRTACCSSPVAPPDRATSTTPTPARPWPTTSSPIPPPRVINDVALTKDGAWFTDSLRPKLYFVPIGAAGVPGPFSTLALTGPAADISGEFNLNGIQATADGKTLIVAHSATASSTRSIPRPAPAPRSPA